MLSSSCTNNTIFIATSAPYSKRTDMQFAITLKNGEQIMCGIANIVGSFTSDANRFRRPGMEIEFSKLDKAGQEFLSELTQASKVARSTAAEQPSPVQPPSSDHLFPKPAAIASPPLLPIDAPDDDAVAPTTTASSPVVAVAPPHDSQEPTPPTQTGSSAGDAVQPGSNKPDSNKLESDKLDADKLDADKLDAGKLDAGKLDADKLDANKLDADKPDADKPDADKLDANKPDADKPDSNKLDSAQLDADRLDADKLDAEKPDADKPDSQDDTLCVPEHVEAKPRQSTAWPSKVAEPERIQGSKFVLPANPLGGLPATSLEAFVDCVLYEETGEIDISSLIDLSTLPNDEPLPITPLIEPSTAPDSEEPPPHFLRHTITNGQAIFLALICLFAGLGFGLLLGSGSETQTALADTKKPQQNANAELLQPPDDSLNLRTHLTGPAPQTPVLGELAPATRVESKLPETTPPPDTDSVPAENPTVKSLDPQPELELAETSPTETVDKSLGDCNLMLDIEPSTASIEIDKVTLKAGVTQVQVPCGKRSYRVRHARYQDRDGEVLLSQGKPTPLRLRLIRPTVTLKVQSSPKGATIKINGRNAGKTPWKRKVPAFENVRISVSSPGYRTHTRKVYPKKSATLSIRLLKIKQVYKPPTRRRR